MRPGWYDRRAAYGACSWLKIEHGEDLCECPSERGKDRGKPVCMQGCGIYIYEHKRGVDSVALHFLNTSSLIFKNFKFFLILIVIF